MLTVSHNKAHPAAGPHHPSWSRGELYQSTAQMSRSGLQWRMAIAALVAVVPTRLVAPVSANAIRPTSTWSITTETGWPNGFVRTRTVSTAERAEGLRGWGADGWGAVPGGGGGDRCAAAAPATPIMRRHDGGWYMSFSWSIMCFYLSFNCKSNISTRYRYYVLLSFPIMYSICYNLTPSVVSCKTAGIVVPFQRATSRVLFPAPLAVIKVF